MLSSFLFRPPFRLPRSKFLALLAVLFVALIGAACGKSEPKANARENGKGESAVTAEAAPVEVTTARAETREVPSYIQTTGSLTADETSDVAPQTSGQVIATPVNVGAFVRQGDVIARLNDRDARLRLAQAQSGVQQAIAGVRQAEARLGLRANGSFDQTTIPEVRGASANLEQAQAELRLAEANELRYRQLVESGDTSRIIYDQYRTQRDTARARLNAARQGLETAINTARQSNQAIQTAQAAVESARAQVSIAEKAVADATVRAPFAGYISNRPIAVGEYVTPAAIAATVLRTNPIKLQLQVSEAEVPFVSAGMGVSLEVEAYKDRKFAGRISAVNPAIDPVSRAVSVDVQVENSDNALRSGMFATARIVRQGGGRSVFVPRQAVLSDQNTQSYRVFVIQDDTAKLRVVQIGDEESDTIQILSGVNADETLATSNLNQLFEGAKISSR